MGQGRKPELLMRIHMQGARPRPSPRRLTRTPLRGGAGRGSDIDFWLFTVTGNAATTTRPHRCMVRPIDPAYG